MKFSIKKAVKIRNNFFIGGESIILPGTTIGDKFFVWGGGVP